MVLQEAKEENILEYATDVKNASMALLGIINEILDSTKLESGMMELVEQDYEISQLLKAALRDQDYVGRWGGEEFLAVLPNADSRQALQIAERVRQAVAEHDWNRQGLDTPVTLSIGVSQHQPAEMIGDCVARADAALYASKHGGRNRVEVAGQR